MMTDGRRRIISDPPLVVPLEQLSGLDQEALLERIHGLLAAYWDSLPADRRHLLDHFTLADVAHKVVGVGSVGTRAWIFLLEGGMESEALLLQGKQAEASALAGYAGDSDHANQGERVVAGQRLMQAVEAVGRDRADAPAEHGAVRPAVWLDTGPRPRPLRRPHRFTGGIDWIRHILQIGAAAVLIAIVAPRLMRRGTGPAR
jgi:Uncharacterized protein conserved in bacteria (DUF2252)